MARNKGKGIGDTTSFTIPEKFNHVDTGEVIPVSAKMLQFINDNIEKRNLVHAIMTAIFNQTHSNARESDELKRVETKIDEVLRKINEGSVFVEHPVEVNTKNDEISDDDLGSILEFSD
jgi:hypothetical protein